MAHIPIDSALPLLAGPVRRSRSADRVHVLVPLRAPCDEVRLTLSWIQDNGKVLTVGSKTTRPVVRNSIAMAMIELELGSAAGASAASLDWDLSLSIPNPPVLQRAFGDLAMGAPLPVFLDVQPPLSEVHTGQLLCAFGPLQLGHLEFFLDGRGVADAGVRAIRGRFSKAVAADPAVQQHVAAALNVSGGLAARRIESLQPQELRSLLEELLSVPFGALPSAQQCGLLGIMASIVPAFELSLAGRVRPRLLGMRLSAAPIPVRGSLRPGSVAFRCHISARDLLAPVLARPLLSDGLSGLLIASGPLPEFADASDLLAARITGPDVSLAEQTRRWQLLVRDGRWLFSLGCSLLGLDMGQAGGRFIVPRVLPDPDAARRRPAGKAEKTGVLRALTAPRPGKSAWLLDPRWDGRLSDVTSLPAAERTREVLDVFPHGGLMAGAEWRLPDLLTQPPAEAWPRIAGTAGVLLNPATWQNAAALRSTVAGLLAPRAFARLGFYYPAPSPQGAGDGDDALATWLARCSLDLSPGDLPRTPTWPAGETLLEIDAAPGAKILGLPVASLRGLSVSRGGNLQVQLGLPSGNWLETFLNGLLGSLMLQMEPPTAAWRPLAGTELLAALMDERMSATSDQAVLEAVNQSLASGLAEELYAPLGLSASPAERDELAASQNTAGLLSRMREARQVVQSASRGRELNGAAEFLSRMIFEGMPRLRIRQALDLASLPGLPPVFTLRGQVVMDAVSPDSGARGVEGGGIFLEAADVVIAIGPVSAAIPLLRLEITPPSRGRAVGLRGEVQLSNFGLPGADVLGARLLIDTSSAWKAAIVADIATVEWNVPGPVNGGSFRMEPIGGNALTLRIEVADGRTTLSPVSLHVALGLIEASGTLRGPVRGKPLELSLSGGWSGFVDIGQVRLKNPFSPGKDAAVWPGLAGVRIAGNGLASLRVAFEDLPAKALNLLHAALPLQMTHPGAMSCDTSGAFSMSAPVTAAISGLVEFKGQLTCSIEGGLPKAVLKDASTRVPVLGGFVLNADVELGPQTLRVSGPTGPRSAGVASLLEFAASAWSMSVDLAGATLEILPMSGTQPRLLGSALPTPGADMRIRISGAGELQLAYKSSVWWSPPGLSGLFSFQPELKLAGGVLRLQGSYRLFERSDQSGTWKHQGVADWTWKPSLKEIPALIGSALQNLFDSNGLLRIADSTAALVLGRDDAWWLELRGAGMKVLWKNLSTPAVRLSQNGQIEFNLPGVSFDANGLTWSPSQAVRVRANLCAPSILAEYWIPSGPVTAAYDGWPSLSLPRLPASGWTSSATPTSNSEKSVNGKWRNVPLLGGATRTQYCLEAPEVRIDLRSSMPWLRGRITTGGLKFRQWVPDNPFTPVNDAHWSSLSVTQPSKDFYLSAGGELDSSMNFNLAGSGSEKPNLKDLLG